MPSSGVASPVGWLRRLPALLAVVLVATAWGSSSFAQSSSTKGAAYRADALQAVFIINFIRFTDWPESPSAKTPFVIGVAGNRSIEDELLELAETLRVRERRIHVVRIKTVGDLAGCHVVYISPTTPPGEEPAPGAAEILPLLREKPVLTVSESPSFIAQGGIVNFFMGEQGKLRFEIALETSRAAKLDISSQLLNLAKIANPPKPAPVPAPAPAPAPKAEPPPAEPASE
jgi:hypothetical protein